MKDYLGDGVYAEITDDRTLLLWTPRADRNDEIYLDDHAIAALERFVAAAREAKLLPEGKKR